MNKETFRKNILEKLSLLAQIDIQSLNRSLTDQIVNVFSVFPELQGQVGAAYLPFKVEIAPVYQELLHKVPVNLAYPILTDGNMEFAIPEGLPKGSTWLSRPYHQVEPQWALIPGIGFDLQGSRLGRGKGFYDRYLCDRKILKIGLAWSEQIVDKIPVEEHDCRMDLIITEKFCWDVTQQKRF